MRRIFILLIIACITLSTCACATKNKTVEKQHVYQPIPNAGSIRVGDIITFGSYEQNNIKDDGKEDIEWIVLEKYNDRILVISKYLLDVRPYNNSTNQCSWDQSNLRAWLNSTFIESAFSIEERAAILDTELHSDSLQQESLTIDEYYSKLDAYQTTDKVYILTMADIERYFPDEEQRACEPTYYTRLLEVPEGAYVEPYNWYTRTPGHYIGEQIAIFDNGSATPSGACNDSWFGIRPCMWLSI